MKTVSDDPALRGLAAIWLRDSCGCADCRDARSGQRLRSITDLPAQVSLTAAALLRAQDRSAFEILARTPVTFAYSDAAAELRATRPMIGVDPRGRVREVRFNGRSMQPPLVGRGGSSGETVSFYAAYRAFAEMITRPDLTLSFRLGPGDCVVLDNTRILHSRTGFDGAGERHLQGCYADLDGVASRLAVLRRERAPRR